MQSPTGSSSPSCWWCASSPRTMRWSMDWSTAPWPRATALRVGAGSWPRMRRPRTRPTRVIMPRTVSRPGGPAGGAAAAGAARILGPGAPRTRSEVERVAPSEKTGLPRDRDPWARLRDGARSSVQGGADGATVGEVRHADLVAADPAAAVDVNDQRGGLLGVGLEEVKHLARVVAVGDVGERRRHAVARGGPGLLLGLRLSLHCLGLRPIRRAQEDQASEPGKERGSGTAG